MRTVAAFFDTDDEATRALDDLLRQPGNEKIETQVVSSRSNFGGADSPEATSPGFIIGGPAGSGTNSGGPAGSGSMGSGPVPVTGFDTGGMFGDLRGAEREYYAGSLRRGGVVVLARVEEDQAGRVLDLFERHGAQVYHAE